LPAATIHDVRFVDGNGLLLQAVVTYPESSSPDGGSPAAESPAGEDDGAESRTDAPLAHQNSARNGVTMLFQVSKPGPVTVSWRSSTGADRRFQVFVTTSMVNHPVQLPIGQELVNASAGGTVEVTATADRTGEASSIQAHLGFATG
jgi:hypothetical protein